MKKILIIAIVLSSSLTACPRSKPSEVGFSCQRLAGCYSAYGSLVKDPQVKTLVENAQKSGLEETCLSAIQQLGKSVGQDCPF